MSLSFGPELLGSRPASASDVTVTVRNTRTPATLSSPVEVDSLGRVSFTVAAPGHYTITSGRLGTNYERNVFLRPEVHDLSDIGEIRDAVISLLNGLAGGGSVEAVNLTADDAPRPDAALVIWQDAREDQTTPPLNMDPVLDWWRKGLPYAAPPDTEDPTVPTSLASSAVTDTSYTVTWAASTDNVGVTGYDWRINGGAPTTISPSPRSLSFTGRTPSTADTVEVRARDAAGNTSDYASIVVTTDETPIEAEEYSIYGASAPTGTFSLGTDGNPYIMFGRGFSCTAVGAEIVGGRVWIPVGATGIPTEVTFYLFGANAGLGSAPVQTKAVSMIGATGGSWVEGNFDVAQAFASGETRMIGARFTSAGDEAKYVYGAGTRPNSNAVPSNGPLGEDLGWVAYGNPYSSQYRIGTDSAVTSDSDEIGYGVDILVTAEV